MWLEDFGKLLRINLSTGKISKETIEKRDLERFVGGQGIAALIYWREVPPKVDPFSEENKLIFATGPLTGSAAPGSGRAIVAGKSPHTYPESYTISSIGGEFGPELRFAGYDVLVIEGKAPKPVYIRIRNDKVEIRSAEHLWGLDTFEVRKKLERELGDPETKIVTIGVAGEKLVRYAAIIHRSGHAAGQGGFGAVMGSKNLKAIAVRGTKREIKVADPEKLLELAEKIKEIATLQGVATNRSPLYPAYMKVGTPCYSGFIPLIEKYKVRNTGCEGCPRGCYVFLDIPDMGGGEMTCVQFYYGWLQHSIGEADETMFLAKQLADKYGIDVYELLQLIPFLRVLADREVISEEESGIPFSDFPERSFIETLLHKIAYREGLGDALAEGTWRFAEKLGMLDKYLSLDDDLHDEIATNVGPIAGFMGYSTCGHGYCAHYDPRDFIVSGILWATNHRDPWSYSHEYIAVVEWSGLDFEDQQRIAKMVWGSEDAVHPRGAPKYDEYEVRAAIIVQNRSAAKNSLILCDWIYPMYTSPATEDYVGDIEMMSKLFRAVTGADVTENDLVKLGERIVNLERAILVRDGRRRSGDVLPEYMFIYDHYWTQSPALDKDEWENMMDMYYEFRGWDKETGIPTREKLESIGLADVAEELAKLGLL